MSRNASQMSLRGSSGKTKRSTGRQHMSTSPAPARARNSGSWRASLGQRALSAAVLIPIIIALVWFGGWIAFAGATLALGIGLYELYRMYAHKGWYPPMLLSAALSLEFLVVATLWHEHVSPLALAVAVMLGISVVVLGSFAWVILTRKTLDGAILDWALTIATPFYLGFPLGFFLLLRGNEAGANNTGFAWLLALFFMVWANDTFALLTGHYFGQHKLSPRISPGKTWEGFAGGLVFTVIAAFVFTMGIPRLFNLPLDVTWYDAVTLGILVAVASTIGDLAESLLKRGTGVKDSGTIVPGHGGILDRMDSLLFAVVIVFFYAVFLHSLPM